MTSQNTTRATAYQMFKGKDRLSTQVYYYIEFLHRDSNQLRVMELLSEETTQTQVYLTSKPKSLRGSVQDHQHNGGLTQ